MLPILVLAMACTPVQNQVEKSKKSHSKPETPQTLNLVIGTVNLTITFPGNPQVDSTVFTEGQRKRQISYKTDSIEFYLHLKELDYEFTDELYAKMKQKAQVGFALQGFDVVSMKDTIFHGVPAFFAVCSKDEELMKMFYSFHNGLIITTATNGDKHGSYENATMMFFDSVKLSNQ